VPAVRIRRSRGGLKALALENELHVIHSVRVRDSLHDVLVGYVAGTRAGVDYRPLQAAPKDEPSAEL